MVVILIPGMLRAAFCALHVCETTIRSDFACLCFRPLRFPCPARTFLVALRSRSLANPKMASASCTDFVVVSASSVLSMMNGYVSGTWWPRAVTSCLFTVAASALRIALCLSWMFIFCDHCLFAFGE